MKLEKLEISSKKVKVAFILGIILTAIIFILINYLTSKASYRNTESIELAKGTINYSMADLNVIAMYKTEDGEDVDIDTVPTEEYKLNERSYCTIPDSEAQIKDVFTYEDGKLNIEIKNKGTKCYLYFDKLSPSEIMLGKLNNTKGNNYEIISLTPPITKNDENSTNKIFKYSEKNDYTYVFRGNVTDNWVTFANHTWRIIRINSDGTLRMIYQCATPRCSDTKGEKTQISGSTDETYNATNNDNTYVGYYFGTPGSNDYDITHSNKEGNNIATYIKNWYNGTGTFNNKGLGIAEKYRNQISGSTGFCNNRRLADSKPDKFPGDGTNTQQTVYIGWEKYIFINSESSFEGKKEVTPDLNCNTNDLFTYKNEKGNGNGALEVPVGLITVDELALAGVIYGYKDNYTTYNWLDNDKDYWTMSPIYFDNHAVIFGMDSSGSFETDSATNHLGVRPVINLKADVTFEPGGDGTVNNPYVVITG